MLQSILLTICHLLQTLQTCTTCRVLALGRDDWHRLTELFPKETRDLNNTLTEQSRTTAALLNAMHRTLINASDALGPPSDTTGGQPVGELKRASARFDPTPMRGAASAWPTLARVMRRGRLPQASDSATDSVVGRGVSDGGASGVGGLVRRTLMPHRSASTPVVLQQLPAQPAPAPAAAAAAAAAALAAAPPSQPPPPRGPSGRYPTDQPRAQGPPAGAVARGWTMLRNNWPLAFTPTSPLSSTDGPSVTPTHPEHPTHADNPTLRNTHANNQKRQTTATTRDHSNTEASGRSFASVSPRAEGATSSTLAATDPATAAAVAAVNADQSGRLQAAPAGRRSGQALGEGVHDPHAYPDMQPSINHVSFPMQEVPEAGSMHVRHASDAHSLQQLGNLQQQGDERSNDLDLLRQQRTYSDGEHGGHALVQRSRARKPPSIRFLDSGRNQQQQF